MQLRYPAEGPAGTSTRSTFKANMVALENAIVAETSWVPPELSQIVVAPIVDDTVELQIAPWQLGLDPLSSVKGESKMVNVFETIKGFLNRRYDSKAEPLQVLFDQNAVPGSQVQDWSMRHHIGMGKSSAARLILDAIFELRLSMSDLEPLFPQVKALLRMRATYDPYPTEEEQFKAAMMRKCALSERPRPDPLQWAVKWAKIFASQNVTFASVIDARIKAYNASKNEEGVKINEWETDFIKSYHYQDQEFLKRLEGHWQYFRVNESAITVKRLAFKDLSPDTKVRRCEATNKLWNQILTWSPQQNTMWIMREIGVFLKNLKLHMKSKKKVNMKQASKGFRIDQENDLTHDEACLFTHFLPEFKLHCTTAQYNDLTSRFVRGMLDAELHNKCKAMSPTLTYKDFAFLAMVTGKDLSVQRSEVQVPGVEVLEAASQEADVNLWIAKLDRERDEWTRYQKQKESHEAIERTDKRTFLKRQDEALAKAVEQWTSMYVPTKRVEDAVLEPTISETAQLWAQGVGISLDKLHFVYVARLDVLGYKYHANFHRICQVMSTALKAIGTGFRTVCIVFAPNTGKVSDCYNEVKINEGVKEVENELNNESWNFLVSYGVVFTISEGGVVVVPCWFVDVPLALAPPGWSPQLWTTC